LLIFASILIALGLVSVANQATFLFKVKYRVALALVVVGLVAIFGGAFYLFGSVIGSDLGQVADAIPRSLDRLRADASGLPWVQALIDELRTIDVVALSRGLAPQAFGLLSTFAGGAISVVVVLAGAVHMANDAETYRTGILHLTPSAQQSDVDAFMNDARAKLERWMLGQLALMVTIGIFVGIALTVIGVPSAPALGLLAGLVEFIPFFGPLVAGTAATLVALAVAPELALWTILAFVVIQQVENQLLAPLILKKAAALPTAVTIFSVISFGVLFGFLGAILAAPLSVVVAVAVQVFYLDKKSAAPPERAE
jgi:predicted PurR-regulated permease PerM